MHAYLLAFLISLVSCCAAELPPAARTAADATLPVAGASLNAMVQSFYAMCGVDPSHRSEWCNARKSQLNAVIRQYNEINEGAGSP